VVDIAAGGFGDGLNVLEYLMGLSHKISAYQISAGGIAPRSQWNLPRNKH
jgi:predicted esterase